MDAFEQIVAKAFEVDGYWTRIGFKVDLTKDAKKEIGKPSLPRPEIDVLAYNPARSELLLIECKSYLDSYGVRFIALSDLGSKYAEQFKLFHDVPLLDAVSEQLVRQLKDAGMIVGSPTVRLVLVAGKVYRNDESSLRAHFSARGNSLAR